MKRGNYGKAQRKLIHAIQMNPRLRKFQFRIFFDGIPGEDSLKPFGQFRFLYSGSMTADKLILEHLIHAYKNEQGRKSNIQITVVSDDLEVRAYAHRFDFRSLKNNDFLRMLTFTPSHETTDEDEEKPDAEISDEQLKQWLDLFNESPEDE